jgi:hypothetical protein
LFFYNGCRYLNRIAYCIFNVYVQIRMTEGDLKKIYRALRVIGIELKSGEKLITDLRPQCPQCHQEQLCYCKSCATRYIGKITQRVITGEIIMCGYCGYANSEDGWNDIFIEQSAHHEVQKKLA